MLKINVNSYVDVEKADEYIFAYYHRYMPLRVIWSVLTCDEKQGYLLRSMQEIETLPVIGARQVFGQKLQFPRLADSFIVMQPIGIFGFPDDGVPCEVKQAQVENALAIINAECHAQAAKQFAALSTLGVVKNTKVSKREMSDAMLEGVVGVAPAKSRLTSDKALQLLRPWLGGFRT